MMSIVAATTACATTPLSSIYHPRYETSNIYNRQFYDPNDFIDNGIASIKSDHIQLIRKLSNRRASFVFAIVRDFRWCLFLR